MTFFHNQPPAEQENSNHGTPVAKNTLYVCSPLPAILATADFASSLRMWEWKASQGQTCLPAGQ